MNNVLKAKKEIMEKKKLIKLDGQDEMMIIFRK